MFDENRCTARARHRGAIGMLVALLCASRLATAQPSSSRFESSEPEFAEVVFEVYEGARAADASTHIMPLLKSLRENGRATLPDEVKRAASGRLPVTGRADSSITVAKIRAKFDAAQRKTTGKGFNHKEAIALYQEGFRWVEQNMATVVADLDASRWLTDAYVGYATALTGENRGEDAKEAYREQIRSFSDLPITSDGYGPEAAARYAAMRKEVDAAPHGTLLVAVNRPDAFVAIKNVGRGRGGNLQANVVAGTYPVLVQVGGTALAYFIRTDPAKSQHAELRIDWDLDSKIRVSDRWVGVEDAKDDIASGLAKKVPNSGVLLISIVERNETSWLVATRHQRGDGTRLRRCVAELGSEAERSMKGCIVDGIYSQGIFRDIPSTTTDSPPSGQVAAPSPLRSWLGLGGTIGAVAVGSYFLSVNGECIRNPSSPAPCIERRDARLQAGLTLGVGVAALVYTTYSYIRYANAVRRASTSPAIGLTVAPGSGALTFSGAF